MKIPTMSAPVVRRASRRCRNLDKDPSRALTPSEELDLALPEDEVSAFAALEAGTEVPVEMDEDAAADSL